MVKLLLSVYFQLLHCRLISYHATVTFRMATKYTGELRLFVVQNRLTEFLTFKEISSNGPSYGVGQAPRASPKGLTRLPNIHTSERYQHVTLDTSGFRVFILQGQLCFDNRCFEIEIPNWDFYRPFLVLKSGMCVIFTAFGDGVGSGKARNLEFRTPWIIYYIL